MFGEGTSVEAIADRQDVTRFGASRISYQHSEERLRLRIGCRRDGREGWVLAETLDPDALSVLRNRMQDALAAAPAGQGVPALADPGPEPGDRTTCYPAAFDATAADRVGWFHAVRQQLGERTDIGGSVAQTVTDHVVADTTGLLRFETRTRTALTVIATRDGASSYGKALHRDPAAIDVAGLADRVDRELADGPRTEPAPAPRVLLGPQAVATLLATFGQLAFGAREIGSGASPLAGRSDEQVLSSLLTVHDDGSDPAGLPTGFDCQGGTKTSVALIRNGIARDAVHDRVTAAAAGVAGTGHGVPPGWRFGTGPSASHLVLDAGDVADAELPGLLGEGLWIQRVDYVRVLQPRQALVTGTTRDATRLVRGGRVAGPAPQLRFTVRLDELLASVLAVGARRERSETVFMESVVAPALVVSSLGDLEPTGR